jgi:hypothetical protein
MVDEATSVTFGAGKFVAVGTHYEWASGSPGKVEARVWLSADGTTWEVAPSDPAFEDAHPTRIITTHDGSLVVFGYVQAVDHMPDEIPVYATWRSADGLTWRRDELLSSEPQVLPVDGVVSGREGYVLGRAQALDLSVGPSGGELWQSRDGLSWELVHESPDEHVSALAAGDEGFVAVLSSPGSDSRVAWASADGREWFVGDALPTELAQASLAGLGGDWVMVGKGSEGPPDEPGPVSPGVYELPVWFSANGLTWQRVASIRWPGEGLGFASPGPLVSVGDRLFLSPIAAGGGPRLSSAGVRSSADGAEWETTDIDPGVTVMDGAEHGGTVVLVGYVGPGQAATFWTNERP